MAAKEKTIAVGQEVEAFCRKCKADTLHKVTVIKEGKIKKAMCSACLSTHAYRAPKKIAMAGAPVTVAKIRKTTRRGVKDWATLVADIDEKSAVTYKLSGDFSNATALSHKIFGIGIITRVISPDKIEVVFKKKTAILAQNLK
jgi:ribosomal protein L44E